MTEANNASRSAYGQAIQDNLVELLHKVTPYVRTEATLLRFDVVAYLPPGMRVGLESVYIPCGLRFGRDYCDRKKRETMSKHKIPREKIDREVNEKFPGYYELPFDERMKLRKAVDEIQTRGYLMDGRRFTEQGMWLHIRAKCKCDGADCPTAIANQDEWTRNKYSIGFGLKEGLHIFEVKSDRDTFERLNHQIPQMLAIADYVWLVIGSTQKIPKWLPPYIGVLQYDDDKSTFTHMRDSAVINRYPPFHSQVMDDHGFPDKVKLRPWMFINLIQKWTINAIFRWEQDGEVVVDMRPELKEIAMLSSKLRGTDFDVYQKSITDFLAQSMEER